MTVHKSRIIWRNVQSERKRSIKELLHIYNKNKCSYSSVEVKLPPPFQEIITDRRQADQQTDRTTNKPRDGRTGGLIGKFHTSNKQNMVPRRKDDEESLLVSSSFSISSINLYKDNSPTGPTFSR